MRYFGRALMLLLLMKSILLYSSSVSAALLEEVIVTAQKREQSMQDIGISVTAFTGDELRALGYTNSTDITMQTPGLNITQFNQTLTNVNIRGVSQNDFADHFEPPIAAYVDGAYVSSMGAAHVQIFDMERIEILRGPQGTLFGRNATGGLIHYISAKPTEQFQGYGELTFAEYDQLKFEGAVSGPLTERVQGRLSVATNRHDGYVETNIGNVRDQDSIGVRGQLNAELTDDIDIWIKLHYQEDDTEGNGYPFLPTTFDPANHFLGRFVGENELATFFDFIGGTFTTCPGCDASGFKGPKDPYNISIDERGFFKRTISGVTGRIDWDFNNITITSITDYLTMNKNYVEDSDGTPVPIVRFDTDQDLDQISQELLIHGDHGIFNWTGGLYYLDIDTNARAGLDPFELGPLIGLPFSVPLVTFSNAHLDVQSWAIFGHIEYRLNPHWSVIGGLRYTKDEKTMDYTVSDNFGTFQQFNTNTFPSLAKQKYSNVSAKAELDWTPSVDTLVYASYSRGHKSGNFVTPFIGPITDFSIFPHEQEVLTSYEVGVKSTLLDGRLQVNISGFYYDYKDYQASFFVQLAQVISNLDAEAYGGEIELTFHPTDELELRLGASFIESEVFDVGLPDGALLDRELPYSPAFTVNGIARYSWSVPIGTLTAQVDFKYSDEFCFSVLCHPTEEEGAYLIGNAKLSGTTKDDRWTVSAFVRNIGNEEYAAYRLDASFTGFSNYVVAPPRWFGGSISYRWE